MNLIVPIFSMRSYETGEYAILKDGNFQLALSRYKDGDYIAVPDNSSDLDELLNTDLIQKGNIIKLKYSENAYETRKNFWKNNNIDGFCLKHNLTLITDITGYDGKVPVKFNFNITSYPWLARPYIDEFLEIDVKSVNKSILTTVLNEDQKTVLINNGANENKIKVTKKVISKRILDVLSAGPEIKIDGIFFPFRLSDKAYRFFDVIEKYKDTKITITDPNFSYKEEYNKYGNIEVIRPTKNEYYRILKSSPTIVYNENPNKIFHPGLAEFIYFGCNIISDYEMPDLKELLID